MNAPAVFRWICRICDPVEDNWHLGNEADFAKHQDSHKTVVPQRAPDGREYGPEERSSG